MATSLSASSDVNDVVRSFVAALTSHDLHAFQPLATVSVARSEDWRWLRDTLERSDCFSINGYRATIESVGPDRARAVVDVNGTASTGTNPPVPIDTPWSLGLTRDADGWHIAVVSLTAREIIQTYLYGGHEWWQSCADESAVPPPIYAYQVADEVTSWCPLWTRQAEALDEAEQLARDIHDPVLVVYCEMFRSRLEWNQRHFDKAVPLAEIAMAHAEANGDYQVIAAAHFILGLAYWKVGQIEKTIANLSYPLDVEKLSNPRIEESKLELSAYIYLTRHDFRQALIATYGAREKAIKYGLPGGEVQADLDLARIHDWLRDHETARQYYAEAVRVSQHATAHAAADALAGMAQTSLALNRPGEAIEYFEKALTENPGVLTTFGVKTSYAVALSRVGRDADAETSLREAIDLAHHQHEGASAMQAWTELSRLRLRQGRYKEALALARNALSESTAADVLADYEGDWAANLVLGRVLLHLHDDVGAAAAFRKAISTIEAQRGGMPPESAARFFDDKSEPYQELIGLLVRQGRADEALRVSERMRSAALLDALSRQVEPEQPLTRDEEERRKELEQAAADANQTFVQLRGRRDRRAEERLRDARVNLDRYAEELALTHPQSAVQRMAEQTFDRSLPPGLAKATVIEYVVAEKSTVVFAVKTGKSGFDVRAHVIPVGRAAIRRRVRRFDELILTRNYDYASAAGALYRDLIQPVERVIDGSGALIVIPDMELWRLPFQTLRRPNGRYLIEDFRISYAPSITALQAASRRFHPARNQRTLLALGNPTLSQSTTAELRAIHRDAGLGALPDAEREVRAIARLYGPDRSRVYVGDDAREATFKAEAPRYDVLHLATHGLLDDASPMYSSLLLAVAPSDRDQDGLLTTREILQLRLKADLAVLAACNTGRGSIDRGEGVVGLSWAFLSAGCPSTVVAQWEVSSAATSELMIRFHRSLIRGQSKADALRQSQLALMRQPGFRHPFYWASFILVGTP